MNEFSTRILILLVQVSVPLTAGLLLSYRRNPTGACRPLTWSGIAVLLLTVCAFLPLPEWTTEEERKPLPAAATAELGELPVKASIPQVEVPAHPGAASGGIDVSTILDAIRQGPRQVEPPSSRFGSVWIYGVLALTGFSLLRFAVGWIGLFRIHLRTQPITDVELLRAIHELSAELTCRKKIRVRQSADLDSAATFGWFRPVIWLSAQWQSWSKVELRAVLAHEIAHVCRRDFSARFLAQLIRAIYACHPLAHGLAHRLQLRQEQAADALAAPCVGGNGVYLRCLAALALKADAACAFRTVPTFLSRSTNLFRRIAMLQVTDDVQFGSHGWRSVAIVGILSMLTLGWQGQNPKLAAEPPATEKPPATTRNPLDISILETLDSPDAIGYYAVRVSDILELPNVARMAGSILSAQTPGLGKFDLNLTDIEQVTGRIHIHVEPKKPAPNHSLQMSLTTIRFNQDIDWEKRLSKGFGKLNTKNHHDETYYEVTLDKAAQQLFGLEKTMLLYPADARTLVIQESAANIHKLIDAKAKTRHSPSSDWQTIADGTLAIRFPKPAIRMKGKFDSPDEVKEDADEAKARMAIETIFAKCDVVNFGLNIHNRVAVQCQVVLTDAAERKTVVSAMKEVHQLILKALPATKPPADSDDWIQASTQLTHEITEGLKLREDGRRIEITGEAKEGITAVRKALEKQAKPR